MKIGFFSLLTIVFITLKLTNYIDWSWWLVLAPIWGQVVVLLILIPIVLVIKVIYKLQGRINKL